MSADTSPMGAAAPAPPAVQAPAVPAPAVQAPALQAPAGQASVLQTPALPVPGPLGPTGRPVPDFPQPTAVRRHGPASVLAICNQKGGVGKTTTTINLGAALAETGRRVLLVDVDPQGALSVGLGINANTLEVTLHDLLLGTGSSPAAEVVVKTRVPGLDLLPSNIDLSAAEVLLVGEVGREHALARALRPLIPEYDVVLIDCQPSLGLLTVNALSAADGVLIPLECEYFALRGVALLLQTIEKVADRLNPRLELVGILATMHDGRTLHGREVLDRVLEAFPEKLFHTVISRTIRFPETTAAGEPITSYATTSAGAGAYRSVARELLARWPAATDSGHASDASRANSASGSDDAGGR